MVKEKAKLNLNQLFINYFKSIALKKDYLKKNTTIVTLF